MDRLELTIGGLSRSGLLGRLRSRGVALNAHAETLLGGAAFDEAVLIPSAAGSSPSGDSASGDIVLTDVARADVAEVGVGDEVGGGRVISVTECTVADLGLADGATLSQIFDRALDLGLLLCPAETGPYLRLALRDQSASADAVMSSGTAPSGSLTVASAPVSDDDEYPKGFYLRVVDGREWLRGYRCDDEHLWDADDRFVFRIG